MSSIPPRIEYDAPLPEPTNRWIHICSPKVGVPLRLRILGVRAVACLTHWDHSAGKQGGGRTVPHTRPDDTCPFCLERGQRPRWHAFLACWWAHSARHVIADLTLQAVQSCLQLNPDSGYSLRGMGLLLRRTGASNNSPVFAELEGQRVESRLLPAEFDVVPCLERLWGVGNSANWRTDSPPPSNNPNPIE